MKFDELVLKNRSYRRFYQEKNISASLLEHLVSLARFVPSGRNMQLLRYILSNTTSDNEKIFSTLAWAGYLTDWQGPEQGERPSAYIIILSEKNLSGTVEIDTGIAAQTILLGAVNSGLGGCMIASVKRETLMQLLQIPDMYHIELVLALGVPKEKVIIEDIGPDGDIRYWRDQNQVHRVPKRRIEDLVIKKLIR